jgi:hypothetical protein
MAIHSDGEQQTFEPELTPLQQQVLDLLHVPTAVYTPTTPPQAD